MTVRPSKAQSHTWAKRISKLLRPTDRGTDTPVVLDLFAGCGGLALGFEAAGMKTIGFEMDSYASETYRKNLNTDCHTIVLAPGQIYPPADVIIGGPPCQPFSVIGEQKGKKDSRDGFPTFIDAVSQVQPKMFLIENVRGLYVSHKHYLQQIIGSLEALGYNVHITLINAKNYGVPQNRERVIIIGSRVGWVWPEPDSELVTAGTAISDLLDQISDNSKFLNEKIDKYIAEYERKSQCRPRDLDLTKPARTVTCRNLYAMTGDMHRVLLPDGRRRMLTVREAARLQSFPDWFEFEGAQYRQFQMIGNAVPPLLGFALAKQMLQFLEGRQAEKTSKDINFGGQFVLEL